MINVICAIHRPLPIWSMSECTQWSLDPMLRWVIGIFLFLYQFRIQFLTHAQVKLSCYRVFIRVQHSWCLIRVQHSWCCGEGLSQLGSLWRGCLQLNTGRNRLQSTIQARVLAFLPHLLARDTGRRYRGHLQLEGKPHHGEWLRGWHRRHSRIDLLLRHRW
jgi:hypothetical protein